MPTRNNDPTIEACLRLLRSQEHPFRVEVVVNHSSDDTVAIARTLAEAVVTARRGALNTAQPERTPRTAHETLDPGPEDWAFSLGSRPPTRIDALTDRDKGWVRHLDVSRKKVRYAVVLRRFVAGTSIMPEAAVAAGRGT